MLALGYNSEREREKRIKDKVPSLKELSLVEDTKESKPRGRP